MINVFIIGARGYIKKYAGWSALIHGICSNRTNKDIRYHIYEVADSINEEGTVYVDGITVIKRYVNLSKNNAMIISDAKNIFHAVKHIKKNKIENPIILFLGLRIGVLAYLIRPYIKSCGAIIMENAAGVEWKRPKWGMLAQLYMRISAFFMACSTDYLICDAAEILNIYNKMIPFKRPTKKYIAYGSYPSEILDVKMPQKVKEYFDNWKIKTGEYYLIVNRFMPENSYNLILQGFINSDSKKDLILVTNHDKEFKYYNELAKKIPFEMDKRVKFVGTLYDNEILNYLRQNAFAYINGHTLGGTNPGLLEAMASTGLVLAHDNIFSREVCENMAFFYKDDQDLDKLIKDVESLDINIRNDIILRSKKHMLNKYSWDKITLQYENLFENSIKK